MTCAARHSVFCLARLQKALADGASLRRPVARLMRVFSFTDMREICCCGPRLRPGCSHAIAHCPVPRCDKVDVGVHPHYGSGPCCIARWYARAHTCRRKLHFRLDRRLPRDVDVERDSLSAEVVPVRTRGRRDEHFHAGQGAGVRAPMRLSPARCVSGPVRACVLSVVEICDRKFSLRNTLRNSSQHEGGFLCR